MPTISSFYGIAIRMYVDDHAPPHFHAKYAEHRAVVDIGRCVGELDVMHNPSEDEADLAADLTEPVACEWEVVAVRPLPGFQLDVEFADGTCGRFDYSALIHRDDAGVFAPLRDVKYFNQVGVVDGAVTWPGELDLAPDAMYDRLKASPPNTVIRR